MKITMTPETDLELTRDIAAATDIVWQCITEPELLEQWFCPRPFKVVNAVIEPVPGGVFHTPMEGPDGQKMDEGPGCVLAVEPRKHFLFTDHFLPGYKPKGSGFLVGGYLLEAIDTGTRLTAFARHQSPEQRDQHEEMGFFDGWGTAADQLKALAEGL